MVRRALFLVIFVVVAAALVAGYGGGEQPEGGGGQDEAGGEAGGSAGSGSSGDFAFVGFYAEIVNWVVSDCALVSAGALLEIVTLPENALVPLGAEITTQEDAETLELIGGAEEEFKEAVLGVNVESRQWGCSVL